MNMAVSPENLRGDSGDRAYERLVGCFVAALGTMPEEVVPDLAYQSIEHWDSLGHMSLVAVIECEFDLVFDTDDILEMASVRHAVAILAKHGVDIGPPE